MIFSSTPETNDDSLPWIAATNGWEGRFATADDARSVEDSPIADVVNMQSLGFVHDPRPEFNRAHAPNPVLLAFRAALKEGATVAQFRGDLEQCKIGYPGDSHLESVYDTPRRFSLMRRMEEHASRVIARLDVS